VYLETQDGFLARSDDGGVHRTLLNPAAGVPVILGSKTVFESPYVLDPSTPNRVLFGTDDLNESKDKGVTWTAIARPGVNGFNPSDKSLSALAVAPSDPTTLYVSAGGHLFVTTNGTSGVNTLWTAIDEPDFNDSFAALVVDPADPATAYAVRNRFTAQGMSGGHVFRTTNGGVNWTDISGNLPNVPAWSLVLDPQGTPSSRILYAGTDVGVYASLDGGQTWAPYGSGLPQAQVRDLALAPQLGILAAGTHGRGLYEIALPGRVGPSPATVPASPEETGVAPAANPALTISTPALMNWTVNLPLYGLRNFLEENLPNLVASGGTGALAFRWSGGTLPPGLSLNGTSGALTGTPTTAGKFFFAITVTDAVGGSAQVGYEVTINPAITLGPAFPNGQPNQPYAARLSATGGTAAPTFIWNGGQLPPGLGLDPSTGTLSGVPTTAGVFHFTVLVVDGVGARTQQSETVTIGPPTSAVNPLSAISPPHFTVSWSGTASAGLRIAYFDVYVSDNGSPYTLWQVHTTATSATFTGQNLHTYSFYSITTDSVGGQEPTPTVQVSTIVLVPILLRTVTVRRGPTSSGGVTFFLTNTNFAVKSPVYLVLTRVSKKVTILNGTGVSTVVAPGSPFFRVADHLAARARASVRVRFRSKGRNNQFVAQVYTALGPL
jgi:hypothetical protein